MGELLDRAYQQQILQRLSDAYPNFVRAGDLPAGPAENSLRVNAAYLHEHGLLRVEYRNDLELGPVPRQAEITATGLDFLAGDGGLGALLNVVTVRLDDETLRALLIERVANSDSDTSAKQKVVEALKDIPAEALRKVAGKMLDTAFDKVPDVVGWTKTSIESVL